MRWSLEQLRDYEQRRQARSKLSCPEPKPVVQHEPLAAAQGTEQSSSRLVVRIIGYRKRLLDPDNFTGGCKYVIDGLRYAGVLPDDTTEQIDLRTSQVKDDIERTEITIERI